MVVDYISFVAALCSPITLRHLRIRAVLKCLFTAKRGRLYIDFLSLYARLQLFLVVKSYIFSYLYFIYTFTKESVKNVILFLSVNINNTEKINY